MEDRERIAMVIFAWKYPIDVSWQQVAQFVKDSYLSLADRLIEQLPELGYTRQPDPPADKVGTLKKILKEMATQAVLVCPATPNEDYYAGEILKLFPEYEPVELEALGDEEINERIKEEERRNGVPEEYIPLLDPDLEYHRVISQETIQKNQSKGQLFRVKE